MGSTPIGVLAENGKHLNGIVHTDGPIKKTEHVSISFELELGLNRSNSEREENRFARRRHEIACLADPRASGLSPRATSPRTRLGYPEVRVRRVLLRGGASMTGERQVTVLVHE